jgi:hypothetical protein
LNIPHKRLNYEHLKMAIIDNIFFIYETDIYQYHIDRFVIGEHCN